jgi:MFS family permease
MGLCSSSFSLAMNTYFKERRNKAFGIGATITGLGPIILPQLVSVLLGYYGDQGCVLIIGAFAMNIIAAGLLLQPVKWHLKKKVELGSIEERDSLYKPQPSISG